MTYIATGNSEAWPRRACWLRAGASRMCRCRRDHLPWGDTIDLPAIGADIPGSPAFIDPEADRPPESVTNDHSF